MNNIFLIRCPNLDRYQQDKLFVTHVLVGHIPIRPLAVGHDLPHDNAVTPHVTCRGEFPILYGFGRSPSDGDFATLYSKIQVSFWRKIECNHTGSNTMRTTFP